MVTEPVGYGSLEDIKASLELSLKVTREGLVPGQVHVHLGDYSKLRGLSLIARKQYIAHMAARRGLEAIIYFGLSTMMQVSIKLARRLNIAPFEVFIAKNYAEGIRLALDLLSESGTPPEELRSDLSGDGFKVSTGSDSTLGVAEQGILSSPEWGFRIDGYETTFEVIDGTILHSVSRGFFKEEHVDLVNRLREKINQAKGKPPGFDYIIAGVEALEGVSRKARERYVASLREWHAVNPFRMYIFYGANRFVRAATYLARPFSPFRIRIAKDLEGSIRIAREDMQQVRGSPPPVDRAASPQEEKAPDQIERYVDELLRYLGSIDWDADGLNYGDGISSSHPFYPVFEAIRLVKGELDELLREREAAQEEKKRLEKQLQHARKMEAIGTLAGGVAHDLNNILSGIVSYPELVLMDLPQDSEIRKPIESMRNSGERAAAIVQDLLTMARRGVVTKEIIKLAGIVSDYLQSPEFEYLQRTYKDMEIETHIDENLLHIAGSPVHLSKTLMNLASNAAEAMPEGGTLTISLENRYIDGNRSGDPDIGEGDYVLLTVKDTGIGISQEVIDRIFEPFYTKKVMGRSGTGIGMAVVWGTVTDHNGHIDIQTEEGIGTTFSLFFPAVRKGADRVMETAPTEDLRGKGETILVVDDVEEQRLIASGLLGKMGYEVASASGGEETLEYLQSNRVDLIILDMIMEPGMDGLETYQRILELCPGQRAIIASGFSESERVRRAQDLGAGAYVKKPYTMEALASAVRRELDREL